MPEIGTAARTVLVIGIGAGDPEHLTLQAAAAIGRAEVFFEIDKGVPDLAGLRATLLARHARPDHRVVTAPEVPRDRDPADYPAEVATWQAARADAYAAMIEAELPPGGVGAFLVWGDPALYDGTLRLLHGMSERLLEAVDRGLWEHPEETTLDALRQAYLETEGELEGD